MPGPCGACGFVNEPGERFCGGCGRELAGGSAPASAEAPVPERARITAPNERRQVTILFADISSYTRMAQELDPEETHAVVQSFFEAVDAVIENFGGTVDKYIGDAVMALFGAPIAHGDDPMRAVRAAVEIHEAVERMSQTGPRPFTVHVGVASGEVIAGGLGAEGRAEYTVIGDSVNLAARLQSHAKGRETLISGAVFHAVSRAVQCEAVSVPDPAGGSEGLVCWRVLGLHSRPADGPRSSIIGREAELRQFAEAVEKVSASGKGRAILLRGEAGLGKTRLLEEFQALATAQGFRHHGAQVLDFGAIEGQDATRILVRSLVEVGSGDGADRRKDAVSAAIVRGFIEAEDEIFLFDLLGLPTPARLRGLYEAMDNATRFAGKKAVIASLIRAASAEAPLFVTVEDLHWARPVTLDYIASLVDSIAEHPVILAMTTRSEGDPMRSAWRGAFGAAPLAAIDLTPLAAHESELFALQFVDRSNQYIAECIERADGNPLFLEQLLHNNNEEQRGRSIPATIQSLVLSRMDRLDAADREALQGASVIGQRFGADDLCHVLGRERFDPERLTQSDLIRPEGDGYRFSHSLIRDGAYSSLLHSRARELHQRAAEFFRSIDPALCAEHLDKAKDPGAAAAYLAAARIEHASYHYMQARLLVERALEIAEDPATIHELHCARGEFLRNLGESAESVGAYERALETATSDTERCRACIGLVEGLRDSQQLDRAMTLLDEAERIATAEGLVAELAQIHGQRGNLYFPMGRVEDCLEQQQLSLDYAKRASSPALEARALSGIADAEYARGRMRTAHRNFADCVSLCRTHGFAAMETPNLALRGLTDFYCGRPLACAEDCDAAIRAAAGSKQQRAELVALTAAAPALIEMLRLDEARACCRRAMELVDRLGARRFLPECLSFLAKIHMAEGDQAGAERLAAEAVEISLESDAGRSFTGPWALGTLAVVTADPGVRAKALAEGEAILAGGCVSHNYLWFYRDAIEAAVLAGDWDLARRYAAALEAFTAPEPLGWPDLYIALARVSAAPASGDGAAGTSGLEALRDTAEAAGLAIALGLLDRSESIAAT